MPGVVSSRIRAYPSPSPRPRSRRRAAAETRPPRRRVGRRAASSHRRRPSTDAARRSRRPGRRGARRAVRRGVGAGSPASSRSKSWKSSSKGSEAAYSRRSARTSSRSQVSIWATSTASSTGSRYRHEAGTDTYDGRRTVVVKDNRGGARAQGSSHARSDGSALVVPAWLSPRRRPRSPVASGATTAAVLGPGVPRSPSAFGQCLVPREHPALPGRELLQALRHDHERLDRGTRLRHERARNRAAPGLPGRPAAGWGGARRRSRRMRRGSSRRRPSSRTTTSSP